MTSAKRRRRNAFHLTFESPRFGNSKRRSRLFRLRDRQVGIHANVRQEFLLCFQRAVLFRPVICTSGTVSLELCIWQYSAIEMRGSANRFFSLLLTGGTTFARLCTSAMCSKAP